MAGRSGDGNGKSFRSLVHSRFSLSFGGNDHQSHFDLNLWVVGSHQQSWSDEV